MALDYDGDFAIVWTGYNASGTRSDVYGRRFDSQAQNRPPVTVDDRYTTRQNQPLTVPAPGVLGNDSDPDGHSLTATLYAAPDHGQVTLHPNGSFTYTPDPNWTDVDYFTYTASDGTATSRITTVEIRITPGNRPPVANNDQYTVAEGQTLTVAAPGVLGNDTDPDAGTTLRAILYPASLPNVGPQHGTVQLNPDGSFTYTPNPGFAGGDRFQYRATDGQAESDLATVSITMTPAAPVAVDDTFVILAGTHTEPNPGVLANDQIPTLPPSSEAVLVTPPASGTLTLNPGGGFTYTSVPGFAGEVTFTYKLVRGTVESNVATVTLVVQATQANRPPLTVDDQYAVRPNRTLTVDPPGVLANDSDPDGQPLTATLYAGPDHGTVTLHPNGSFTYTPDPGWDSVDYFTYTASDGTATSRITTVEIRITTNLPPVAKDDLFDTDPGVTLTVNAPGVLLNDRDDGGPPSTAVLLSRPAQGTLQFNSNGSFRYIPASNFRGSVRFTYKANDGATDSNVATVTIRVGGPRADMAVSQSVSGRPEAGRTNVYTIVVRNNGPNPATDTRLLQTFSGARPRIESVRTSRGRCFPQPGSSYFQCEFETLQRGQAAIVRVSVTYGLVGPTSSHAVVGADEPDPNERNNASLVRRTIRFPIER